MVSGKTGQLRRNGSGVHNHRVILGRVYLQVRNYRHPRFDVIELRDVLRSGSGEHGTNGAYRSYPIGEKD